MVGYSATEVNNGNLPMNSENGSALNLAIYCPFLIGANLFNALVLVGRVSSEFAFLGAANTFPKLWENKRYALEIIKKPVHVRLRAILEK